MRPRISAALFVLTVLLVVGVGSVRDSSSAKNEEAAVQPLMASTDHTNPPVVIGKGGLLWDIAIGEHADNCRVGTDDCGQGLWCVEMNSATWCVKPMYVDRKFKIFNDDGTCTGNEGRIDPSLIANGTDWAKVKDKTSKKEKDIKNKSIKFTGTSYRLELTVGKNDRQNAWKLYRTQPTPEKVCQLSSGSSSNPGVLPAEFADLSEIDGENGEPPLGFATCKKANCVH